MNKKTLAAVIAILILICATCAFALVRCTDAEDVSSEISKSSVIDESEVSEPSETSVEADASADTSNASKDPAEVSDASADPPDEPSDEVSKEQENNSSTPEETSKEESIQPGEVSKPAEESEENETSKNEETSSTTPGEIVKPNEESKVEETSKDETSKGETSKEENVVHGNTPLNVVINGKKETVDSYEEAKVLLTLEDLDGAEKGYVIVLEARGVKLTFVANGDGTFVNTETGRNRSAQQVYDSYISQWCSYCGKRAGNGTNGTCVRKLIDVECSRCGEFCKMLECHTCVE